MTPWLSIAFDCVGTDTAGVSWHIDTGLCPGTLTHGCVIQLSHIAHDIQVYDE